MPYELIYTSVDKGLKLGSRGFCTVAQTTGLAPNIALTLESLSGYRYLNPSGTPNSDNPVVYSSLTFPMNGRLQHIFSRIADAGLDYSARSNKIAHHFLFTDKEYRQFNQAAILQNADELFVSQWDKPAQWFPSPKTLDLKPLEPAICHSWEAVALDAGWAGVLANTAVSGQNVCLIYAEGQDVKQLLTEALALVPAAFQWNVSFSSFYTKFPPGVSCQWKCVLKGTPEENVVRLIPNSLTIDLTNPSPLPEIDDDQLAEFVELARTGLLENFHWNPAPAAPTQVFVPSSVSFNESLAKNQEETEKQTVLAENDGTTRQNMTPDDFFHLPENSSLLNQLIQVPVPTGSGDALKMQNIAIEELNKYYEALVQNNHINKQRNILFTSVLVVSIAILITLIISAIQDKNVKNDLEAVPGLVSEIIEPQSSTQVVKPIVVKKASPAATSKPVPTSPELVPAPSKPSEIPQSADAPTEPATAPSENPEAPQPADVPSEPATAPSENPEAPQSADVPSENPEAPQPADVPSDPATAPSENSEAPQPADVPSEPATAPSENSEAPQSADAPSEPVPAPAK